MINRKKDPSFRRSLNTLAESGTAGNFPKTNKQLKLVLGKGSDLNNSETITGRVKRKNISVKLHLALVDVVKKKGETERIQSYWNGFYCFSKVTESGGRLYGKYCKSRSCPVCCANRKADLINEYLRIVQSFENPFFVTLTIKSISKRNLRKVMDKMIKGFTRIRNKYKKRDQRGKGKKLIGIRCLECCFNPDTKKYNPHFHLIVSNEETAKYLIREWLALWKGWPWVIRKAQDMRPINTTIDDLIELIKYGAKIINEPNEDRHYKGNESVIYAAAMDTILQAMKGKRILERFGFNQSDRRRQSEISEISDYQNWKYLPKGGDWFNTETLAKMTDYSMTQELKDILENNIDKELQ